nr:MAG TPA: hypothetical protein [Caudoviricetes sp.]
MPIDVGTYHVQLINNYFSLLSLENSTSLTGSLYATTLSFDRRAYKTGSSPVVEI